MPALDSCHSQVVRALQKDGWYVEEKPLRIEVDRRLVFIDIEALRQINGHHQHRIVAEVKCFANPDDATRDIYSYSRRNES